MKILKVKGTSNIYDVFYGNEGWHDHMRVRVMRDRAGKVLSSAFLFGTQKDRYDQLKPEIEGAIGAGA